MNKKQAEKIAGPLGYPSKMPGTSYGLSAFKCKTGAKLAKIPGSVCHGCYAMRGNYLFAAPKAAQARRLRGIKKASWVDAMVAQLEAAHGN
jgi:hypothetical protein